MINSKSIRLIYVMVTSRTNTQLRCVASYLRNPCTVSTPGILLSSSRGFGRDLDGHEGVDLPCSTLNKTYMNEIVCSRAAWLMRLLKTLVMAAMLINQAAWEVVKLMSLPTDK